MPPPPSISVASARANDARPTIGRRLAASLAVALAATVIVAHRQLVQHALGSDFLVMWRATKIVLDGGDPYRLIQPFGSDWSAVYWYYPLPAIGFALPFVQLKPEFAVIAFIALSTFGLAFVLSRDGFYRFPLFMSSPFFVCVRAGQMSAATMALGLVPAAAGLALMKPNIGLALFARAPAWRTVAYGGMLFLGAIAISPGWLSEWRAIIAASPNHRTIVALPGGVLLLAAMLRWRTPEARLLAAMAAVPHALYFYDELPLWLIPRTYQESRVLMWCSWAAFVGWNVSSYNRSAGTVDFRDMAGWTLWLLYLPALLMVMRRQNIGKVPEWLERAMAHVPRWLRGEATVA